MLLFRSEDHIDRWCNAWHLPRGATLSVDQASQLADRWYSDRLSPQFRRKTVEEAHAIFASLGLTGEFWKLG
ncbi:MAG TPA: hypothetical protein VJA94_21490 [Candidatus Angelobacter sp.]